MSRERKPSAEPQKAEPRPPQPAPKRQRASAQAATNQKQFRDEPGVQQTLFTLDEGGAK